ncbi:hypothetical protein Glove_65g99 [Diversispora epigaea]|uniref:F-box domain-containing protein n=1 Tax=Diversispora epigaea TaxID=1348612 RepID=A0A397JHS9_9GLOM|nr:hypothetical protein Glove_65g99 [Diversispora epigaea]
MIHPLIIPELLENIFSFLAKDKALYPTLFVNHLWYHCSAPILWERIEFFTENPQRGHASVIEIARSCPNLVYLNLNGQPFINNESICTIARSRVNLQHLDLSFNKIIIDEAICTIATGCPDMRSYFFKRCDKSLRKIIQSNLNLQNIILPFSCKITDDAVCDIISLCSIIHVKKYNM